MKVIFAIVCCLFVPAAADTPLGSCHACEVTCFEDCSRKYNEEIIQADRMSDELKQRMLATNGGGHLAARGLSLLDSSSLVDKYFQCLKPQKCQTPNIIASQPAGTKQPNCNGVGPKALKCTDAAVPWNPDTSSRPVMLQSAQFPLHPVVRQSFSLGRMTLDFCLKSCLGVTCGCHNAPGFDKISQLHDQIKANEAAKLPLTDTGAVPHYKPATMAECGKGHLNVKITHGLYVDVGTGYNEICTADFFEAFLGPDANLGGPLAGCQSNAPEAAFEGCAWIEQYNHCGYHHFPCFVRYETDPTL